MFPMTRLRLPGTLVIAAALAALLALAAFSSEADASHSWKNFHWARTSNPFTLKVGDNVSSEWDAYLNDASRDWSDSRVLDLRVVRGQTNPKSCRPTSGRVEVCNARYGDERDGVRWLGVAQIWFSGDHIVQATTKLNDTYFERDGYDTTAWRRFVMCQEVGHTFGLDHQDEIQNNRNLGTCMDYTNDPNGGAGGAAAGDPSNERPNQHDYEQLEDIYRHTDTKTTVGSTSAASTMVPAANREDFNSQGEWGQKVRESRNGRLELWERSFGGGAKLITWVIRP